MLERVIAKAYHATQFEDLQGNLHDIKVLNFTASGSKSVKLDRQCVVDVDTEIEPGLEILIDDAQVLIVSYKQGDYHNDTLLRYTLDCITATHRVTVTRTVKNKTDQGGLASQTNAVVYPDMPVKICLTDVSESKTIDVRTPRFTLYVSHRYNLSIGDRLTVNDTTFEEAKIESLVHVTPGLLEIRFDRDPRWL